MNKFSFHQQPIFIINYVLQCKNMELFWQIYSLYKHKGSPVVTAGGLKIEAKTRRFPVDEKKEAQYRAEIQNKVYKRELVEVCYC